MRYVNAKLIRFILVIVITASAICAVIFTPTNAHASSSFTEHFGELWAAVARTTQGAKSDSTGVAEPVSVRLRTETLGACSTAPANLVSWYQGENNAIDFINTNNGAIQGNVNYTTGNIGQTFTLGGTGNTSGVGDRVLVGNPANLQLQDFTIEGWIKRSSNTIVTNSPVSGFEGGSFFAYGSGGYGFVIQQSTNRIGLTKIGTSAVYSTTATITDTNFHHVAVTKSGNQVTFFVDGVADTPTTYNITFTFGTNAAIGARGDNDVRNAFFGSIDELSIYNRSLAASEIQAIVAAGSAGKCFTVNTFTVTNTNDSGAGSLRQAVLDANAATGVDAINFDTGVFSTPQTITLTSGELLIANANVTITGPGANLLTVSGNNASRIFTIPETPVVSISGMTLTSGNGTGSLSTTAGGAILNQGELILNNMVITGNTATGFGGGIQTDAADRLTVANSTLSNNTSTNQGGGIQANDPQLLNITNSTFSNNTTAREGGGLFASAASGGTVTISGSTFSNNTITATNSTGGGGIAFFTATASITNSIISGNSITAGPGAGGGLRKAGTGTITISSTTIDNNSTTDGAGGIVNDATGGGGTINITNSTVSNNRANTDASANGDGGGIYGGSGTSMTISNSTISGNSVLGFAGAAGNGGGIFMDGALTLTNSTISGNSATRDCGGILDRAPGAVAVSYTTIVNNAAGNNGGGFCTLDAGSIRGVIIANNTAVAIGPDGGGSFNSLDHNLIENTTNFTFTGTTTNNITGQDPNVGPLQNNGGVTFTHALLPGSPAIDKGASGALTEDQRLQTRFVDNPNITNASGGNGADIGAFEVQPAVQFSSATYSVAENSGTATITVNRVDGSEGVDSVAYTLTNGTATGGASCGGGVDYINTPGVVTLNAGETSKTFDVTLCNDSLFKGSETVNLALSAPIGATLGTPTAAVLTILNDDTPTPTNTATSTNTATATATATGTPTTFVVTNTDDSGTGSLRQAVLNANAGVGPDFITFDPDVFSTPQIITLTSGNIVFTNSVNSNVTITGPGANLLTVSGGGTSKIFSNLETAVVSISGMTLTGGNGVGISPGNTFGGAVYNQGVMTLTDMVITGNTAASDGGGVYNSTSDSMTIIGCVITNNTAASQSGGAHNHTSATMTITDSTISNNVANAPAGTGVGGGAIYSEDGSTLSLTNSTISGNQALSSGGGIVADSITLTVTNSTISGNSSAGRVGGGIAFDIDSTATITGSTISGNTAATTGGGLNIEADTNNLITITNSTISGNSAPNGGGIFRGAGASLTVTLSHTTVANNTATTTGGGISGTMNLGNTLVGNNTATTGPDYAGTLNSNDYNLIENTAGATVTGTTTNNITGQDPNLGTLADNGGVRFTHALNTGSPAIDKGASGALTADQRGQTRFVDNPNITNATGGNGSDIGAFEVQPSVQFSSPTYANNENSGSATITVDRVGGSEGVDTVNYATSNGTATGGASCGGSVDYVNASGTLNFNAGVTSQTFNVTLCPDSLFKSSETINLTLSLPVGATLGTPTAAVLTILNDDTPTPTNTSTFTPTSTSTNTATATSTNTPSATSTATFTPTNTATATATSTNTATPTPTAPVAISGTVTYGNAIPAATRFVSNVLMNGVGSPNVSTTTSFPGGTYSLTGFGAGSYTVTPTKTGAINGAISSFDAARISQHAVGPPNPQLTGNQLLVADTSNNGTISSFDAAQVAGYSVNSPPFGQAGQWKFLPVSRTYASVASSIAGEDYSALLMGEVTGNWTNTNARTANGPEREIAVTVPNLATPADDEVIVPVTVHGAMNKGIISYEFDLRYDPTVIQPQAEPVGVAGTVSGRLSFAVNAKEPGLLRVAVYGPVPIAENGVLLNLRFTAVGAPGSVSPLTWERLVFNEGDPQAAAADGQVELSAATPNSAEISGRLLDAMGQGIPNARVILTDSTGQRRSTISNGFGVYRFGGLQVGQTYTVSIESRHYAFDPLTVSITGQILSLDLIAEK